MRKFLLLLIATSFAAPSISLAQRQNNKARPALRKAAPSTVPRSSSTREATLRNQLSDALRMAQSGQYDAAANNLFSLSRRPELASERPQVKYILGTMLIELKLYQTAAFQFVDVIRSNHPKYSKLAIEKLSVVADALGDDTILKYAISRVDLNDFPANLKDMIHYRLGEIKLRNRDFSGAAD